MNDSGDEDEVAMEDIDYTDANFILQNLISAIPTYDNDKTMTLQGRQELANTVSLQVLFYCYLAFQGFLMRMNIPPSILVFGDGFIGSNIIEQLCKFGCGPFLKIYTRGDYSCKEWRSKGLHSDSALLNLLKGQRPDIVIINVENSSFAAICNLINSSNILSQGSFVISTTFGFQRRKIYNNLKLHSIFRTYIEPQDHAAEVKSKLISRAAMSARKPRPRSADISSLGDFKFDDDTSTLAGSEIGIDAEGEENIASRFRDDPSLHSTGDIVDGSSAEVASALIATRSKDICNLLYLVENFYALQGMSYHDARATALRSIFNYRIEDESLEESSASVRSNSLSASNEGGEESVAPSVSVFGETSREKAEREKQRELERQREMEMRHNQMSMNAVLQSLHESVVNFFQQVYRSMLSVEDLRRLAAAFPVGFDPVRDLRVLPEKERRRFFLQTEAPAEPRTGGQPSAAALAAARKKKLQRCPMYCEDFLTNEIFAADADYSGFSGPGIDFLVAIDRKSAPANYDKKIK